MSASLASTSSAEGPPDTWEMVFDRLVYLQLGTLKIYRDRRQINLSLRLRSKELVWDTRVPTGSSSEEEEGRDTFKGEKVGFG